MPHPQGKTPINPEPPKSLPEAAELIVRIQERMLGVKRVLEAHGLAPAHFDEEWELPVSEEAIFNQTLALMCDIQQIENLLVDKGITNETEFTPLSPRWRIDGRLHHYRNWRIFEHHVRNVITAERSGIPPSESVFEFRHRSKDLETLDTKQR